MSRRTLVLIPVLLGAWLAVAKPSEAAPITYNLSFTPSASNSAVLTGTLQTDGTLGQIFTGNILSFSFTQTVVAPFTLSSSDAGAFFQCIGTAGCFTAAATTLSFNFASTTVNDPFANFGNSAGFPSTFATVRPPLSSET